MWGHLSTFCIKNSTYLLAGSSGGPVGLTAHTCITRAPKTAHLTRAPLRAGEFRVP